MSQLANRECIPCKGGIPPLQGEALDNLKQELGGGWRIIDDHHLEKQFSFKDFQQALDFTNKVGDLAESVNHHPTLCLSWGWVRVSIWTHKIDGLTESDFVFAAKTDALY